MHAVLERRMANLKRWYSGEPDPETKAKFEQALLLKRMRAESKLEPTDRIWKRLTLYRVGWQIASLPGIPDCTKVEQTGTVAVPVSLIRQLQEAVEDYPGDPVRVVNYR